MSPKQGKPSFATWVYKIKVECDSEVVVGDRTNFPLQRREITFTRGGGEVEHTRCPKFPDHELNAIKDKYSKFKNCKYTVKDCDPKQE